MLKLPCIFSSGALFQADSVLCVHGIGDAGSKAEIRILDAAGQTAACVETVCCTDGFFRAELKTPAASFEEYSIAVTCGGDSLSAERVLFG